MNYWWTKYVFCFLIFSISFVTLNAQEEPLDYESCHLLPPEELTITDLGPDYFHVTWSAVNGATAYQVIVFDINTNAIFYNEIVYLTETTATNVSFDGDVYISIASVCSNGELGELGGAPIHFVGGPIGVGDIVMQMEGEPNTRVLECEDLVQSLGKINASNNPISLDFGTYQSIIISLDYQKGSNTLLDNEKIVFNASGNPAGLVAFSELEKIGNNLMYIKQNNALLFNYTRNNGQLSLTFDPSIYNQGIISGTLKNCPIGRKLQVKELESGGVGKASPGDDFSETQASIITPNARHLLVFPNPAQSNITVLKSAEAVLFIKDINGRIMHYSDRIEDQASVSIVDWPSGIYIVDSIEDGQHSTFKLFKL